jgi:tetratricopeptide (TPR) repeat protein
LYLHKANLARLSGDWQKTLDHLLQALEDKELEADTALPRNLIAITTMIGDTLCRMNRFKESYSYFNKAIKKFESSVGSDDLDLGTYYLMNGEAHGSGKDYMESQKLIKKAISIFEKYPGSREYVQDLPRAKNSLEIVTNKMRESGNIDTSKPSKKEFNSKSSNSKKRSKFTFNDDDL